MVSTGLLSLLAFDETGVTGFLSLEGNSLGVSLGKSFAFKGSVVAVDAFFGSCFNGAEGTGLFFVFSETVFAFSWVTGLGSAFGATLTESFSDCFEAGSFAGTLEGLFFVKKGTFCCLPRPKIFLSLLPIGKAF